MATFIGSSENSRRGFHWRKICMTMCPVLFGGGQPVGGYWLPEKDE